jgi:hypothetical protein
LTTLIIKRIDVQAKGSLAEYRRLIDVIERVEAGDLGAQKELIDYVLSKARTDDGRPVEEAAAEMSLQDFFAAARGIMNAGGEMVPNASTSSSNDSTS